MTRVRGRKEIIQRILGESYSQGGRTKGTMVESLAVHIDKTWADIEFDVIKHRSSLERQLTVEIWYWFTGGDTAEAAARKIISALYPEGVPT